MIGPEDAPDASRRALGWMPERGDLSELRKQMEEEEEKKKSSEGKKVKGKGNNKKKKGSKKND